MSNALNYAFLKCQALVLLVFNRKRPALARFDAMLQFNPCDVYALASRAHVLSQLQDKHGAVNALRALVAAHPGNAVGLLISIQK